jgi:hypothetical protein
MRARRRVLIYSFGRDELNGSLLSSNTKHRFLACDGSVQRAIDRFFTSVALVYTPCRHGERLAYMEIDRAGILQLGVTSTSAADTIF